MPDPVKKPPKGRLNELRTEITSEMWEKYSKKRCRKLSERHERDTKMITDLIAQLAEAKAIIEIYEME